MVVTSQAKTYTVEEYLALEVESEVRHEYCNGEIRSMTGGTPNHNELIRALTVVLSLGLRGKPYRLFLTDQRLWIPDGKDRYTYPDLMVVPQPVELQPGQKDTVINPVLIVEVLSESTEGYDRGNKFAAYRSIPSFQEYLLVDQKRLSAERYVKQDAGQWLFTEYHGDDAKVWLSSIELEISIGELYENVEF